jgi:polysaccharide deacetylase family sporulation protein PdaB
LEEKTLKVVFISKKTIINIALVICITMASVFYAMGGRLGFINVFLNTQKEIPIYSVATEEKKLALTFDAAWGDQYTDEILSILEKNNVKATFFLVGSWTDKYGEKVKKISSMGHEIGNHSLTHPHFTQLDSQKIKDEIYAASDKIKEITGKSTNLFRPPFGDYNSTVVKTIRETGHFCIQWDVDSLDWTNPGENVIYDRIISNIGNGSILLFHNNAEQTPKVLDRLIKAIKKQGYKFVTVSEMIYKDNFFIDHTGKQRMAKP